MADLSNMKCTACSGDEPPLDDNEIDQYLKQVFGWKLVDDERIRKIEKSFSFKNFRDALDFTIRVGEKAEENGHHPQITTEWGSVSIRWWTHKIGGLHLNDFIMAAVSDQLYAGR